MKTLVLLVLSLGLGAAHAAPECSGVGFPGEEAPQLIKAYAFGKFVRTIQDPESGQKVCYVTLQDGLRNRPPELSPECKGATDPVAVSCAKFENRTVDGHYQYCLTRSDPRLRTLPTCRVSILSFEAEEHQW
jgi:hypothetical protein